MAWRTSVAGRDAPSLPSPTGLTTAADALFRDYLSNTTPTEERDVDFCVPSTMLPAMFTKWQLVFAPLNGPVQIDLALAAPR